MRASGGVGLYPFYKEYGKIYLDANTNYANEETLPYKYIFEDGDPLIEELPLDITDRIPVNIHGRRII